MVNFFSHSVQLFGFSPVHLIPTFNSVDSEIDVGLSGMSIYFPHALLVVEECADVVFLRFYPAYFLEFLL